jgi:hypothetical protein
MRYAHINSNTVVGIYYLTGEVARPDYIQSETAELRQIYDPVSGEFADPVVPVIPAYTIADQQITANGQTLSAFAGNYYCQPGDTVQLVGNITDDGDTVTSINVPVTLKMPLVRHANGQPTQDEIYLNVTLLNGVITATGNIERSGDWKILIDRNNEALHRIGAQFKLAAADITFLA